MSRKAGSSTAQVVDNPTARLPSGIVARLIGTSMFPNASAGSSSTNTGAVPGWRESRPESDDQSRCTAWASSVEYSGGGSPMKGYVTLADGLEAFSRLNTMIVAPGFREAVTRSR